MACSGPLRSTVSIPAGQEFVLGEPSQKNYQAKLNNLSDAQVRVKVVDKKTQAQTQVLRLAANEEANVYISGDETVYLINPNDEDAKVKVFLSKGVEGMRYQEIKSN